MRVSKEFTLEASHIIPHHPGACRRLHGHSWKVVVELEGSYNPKTGMMMDFADLKEIVQPIVDRLDHQHLNFFMKCPTAENLAIYFAHEIGPKVGDDYVVTVKIKETAKTEAVYCESTSQVAYDIPGLESPFSKVPVFKDEKARDTWFRKRQSLLEKLQQEMTQVGAELASAKLYYQSLDRTAGDVLLHELGK